MPDVEFRLLGPLEASVKGETVALGGRRQRAVLALLLLEANRVVSTDRLIDGVWGERPPPAAEVTLRGYVSRLRKAVGSDLLQTAPAGYRLAARNDQVDLGRFHRLLSEGREALADGAPGRAAALLRDALELWRGRPLADLADAPFAVTEAERLEELRLAALEDRIEADLALGRHAELVGELEALIAEHPLRERPRGQLMLALYRSGRQAEALEAYREARATLVEELGIDPSRTLQELEKAILTQDLSLDVPVARPAVAAPPRLAIVGREAELARLWAAFEEAVSGRGGVAVVTGEPGIGKTTLVEELQRQASAAGTTTALGRCWEAGGAPPYWPWAQTVRTYLASFDPDDIRERLGPRLEEIAGSVRQLLEFLPELRSVPPERERFRSFEHGVAWMRLMMRGRPHVNVLDDLHAADIPSLLLLRHMATSLAGIPALIVAVWRDTDLEPGPVAEHLSAVVRDACCHVRLEGLNENGVASVIEQSGGHTPSPGLVVRIHETTQGNPLFVGEIVRLLEDEGQLEEAGEASRLRIPQRVRDVIGKRLDRLSNRTRALLTVASVLGPDFYVTSLERVAGLSRDELLDSLDEALAARALTEDPEVVGRLRFAHMLIRETLYGELTPARRMRLHGQVGTALEEIYGDDVQQRLDELAHHFFEAAPAGEAEKALVYASRAAARAATVLAYEEAERLYRDALSALELAAGPRAERRCELLLALGDVQTRAGDTVAAQETFLAAAEAARSAALPEHLARAALGYGGRFVWSRGWDDRVLVPLLEEALEGIGTEDGELRVRLLSRLAGGPLRDSPEREPRASLSAEAVGMARRLGDPELLSYALVGRWEATWWPENPEERLEIAVELVGLSDPGHDLENAFEAHHHYAATLFELGRLDETEVELAVMTKLAKELRQPAQLWAATSVAALAAVARGQFASAEELVSESLLLGERAQHGDAVVASRVQTFLVRREQGRLEEVGEAIAVSLGEFPTRRSLFGSVLANLHATLGRHRDASRALDLLGDLATLPRDNEWLFALSLLPEACALVGDRARAAVLYELLAPYADRLAVDLSDGVNGGVSRPLGLLAGVLGRPDDAVRHLEDAVQLDTEFGAWPWVARSQYELARALVQRGAKGDLTAAKAVAGKALDRTRSLGMPALEAALVPLAGP